MWVKFWLGYHAPFEVILESDFPSRPFCEQGVSSQLSLRGSLGTHNPWTVVTSTNRTIAITDTTAINSPHGFTALCCAMSEPAGPLHTLDVYASPSARNAPEVFWIRGGGWQGGDKSDVAEKPRFFVEKGFVFVLVNYRLLPKVEMVEIFHDVAKSFRWVHYHIAEYGGDANHVLVGGHSAGAQLAALICTNDRYLKAEGIEFTDLIGCVSVDGDTRTSL